MSRESKRIDQDPEVRAIADALGLRGPDLKAKICGAAVERVIRRMDALRIDPERLDDVQTLVLDLTRLRILRIDVDEDLERFSSRLKQDHPALPVQLEFEFARNTEALVYRNGRADPRAASYTAVVDARGARRFRAWFAERHEPAHLLIPDPANRTAWRRTTVERPEPVEQVVDEIASRVGFWEPIVLPVLRGALASEPSVLDAFDATREALCPGASQEASYRAFTRLTPFPLCMLRVDLACRKGDPENDDGSLALRARTVLWNHAADEARIRVWPNFRIPAHSVIHDARDDVFGRTHEGDDDLAEWRTESGQPLARFRRPVRVTARGFWATIEVGK